MLGIESFVKGFVDFKFRVKNIMILKENRVRMENILCIFRRVCVFVFICLY